MTLTPINLKTANAFVQQYHRHHKPTRGHKFSIGVSENGALVGVAICGRPVARRLDDGYTLEVNRLCTDGTPNACSILYAAAYRAARAMGYNKVITYILDTENGSSLKAAGYTCEGRAGGLEWNGAKAPKQADQYCALRRLRTEHGATHGIEKWEKVYLSALHYEPQRTGLFIAPYQRKQVGRSRAGCIAGKSPADQRTGTSAR